MPMKFWRIAAPVFLLLAGFFAASATYAQPAAPGSAASTACVLRSGHAWQIRRFVTARVTLYSLDGQRLASVSRNDLADVRGVVQCDNTSSFVKMDTRFGPRLAMRSSLVLGGGLGGACRCVQAAGSQFDSNAARSASSSGVGEGEICNADLPCRR
jgi:hypothetical protein